ncbi:MAG: phosphonopyruvate decarboxylase [Gammaproteobacteria bacterium]|nr:MAG: phosphonopyruvate decarboxylase [Gammaproteobacteria bacterium]
MIPATAFAEAARRHGFGLYTGVPCSFLKPLINFVIDDPDLRYVGATNEGDAVAIAAGAELGGLHSVVMLQNSGLGNAVNPLSSLTWPFRLPVLLIVTLRGDPDAPPDEPQHHLMGQITAPLLEMLDITWEIFPEDEQQISGCLDRASKTMSERRRPHALLMKKGTVQPVAIGPPSEDRWPVASTVGQVRATQPRRAFLRSIQSVLRPTDLVIATTGYTSRELYACGDLPSQLYMVGSMGCASSLGLGLALARPDRRVIVLDGDGALLMRMGALATIGRCRPGNLFHVLLDNQVHESTGGQATGSGSVDLCAVAAGCGSARVNCTQDPGALADLLAEPGGGLRFVRVMVEAGIPEDLPRPDIQPESVARRFMSYLRSSDARADAAT